MPMNVYIQCVVDPTRPPFPPPLPEMGWDMRAYERFKAAYEAYRREYDAAKARLRVDRLEEEIAVLKAALPAVAAGEEA
ncbi:MAG: hypothetical protein GX591_11995 [Planctomycetes bacterium]|nr:hypothetical protein [Planctomycetota bacterium]